MGRRVVDRAGDGGAPRARAHCTSSRPVSRHVAAGDRCARACEGEAPRERLLHICMRQGVDACRGVSMPSGTGTGTVCGIRPPELGTARLPLAASLPSRVARLRAACALVQSSAWVTPTADPTRADALVRPVGVPASADSSCPTHVARLGLSCGCPGAGPRSWTATGCSRGAVVGCRFRTFGLQA